MITQKGIGPSTPGDQPDSGIGQTHDWSGQSESTTTRIQRKS